MNITNGYQSVTRWLRMVTRRHSNYVSRNQRERCLHSLNKTEKIPKTLHLDTGRQNCWENIII